MITYSDFLKKQGEIYANHFHPGKWVDHFDSDETIDRRYNIVLKYPDKVTDEIKEFSRALCKIVPSSKFSGQNCHTTVAVFRGEEINTEIPASGKTIIKKLIKVAKEALITLENKKIKIYLGKMLINPTSAILSGYPDDKFIKFINKLEEKNDSFFRFRLAWGAHITTARFHKHEKDHYKISQVLKLVDNFKIFKNVSIDGVVVTKFEVNSKKYNVIKEYTLS